LERAKAAAAKAAAIAGYERESDKVWALLKSRQYDEAGKLVAESSKREEFKAADACLKADAEAIALLRDLWAAAEAGVANSKGQRLVLASASGTIEGAKDGVITLWTADGGIECKLFLLAAKQAIQYAGLKDKADPRSKLMAGVFLLAEGVSLDEARDALPKASEDPSVAAYKARLQKLRRGAPEADAKAAWLHIQDEAKAKFGPVAAKRVADLLADFEKKHGDTRFYKGLGDQLTELNERIAKSTAPTVYIKWPFDEAEAMRRQKATAETLGVRVEQDIDLGGGVKMTFVLIPAGEFLMGSPPTTSPEKLALGYGGNPGEYEGEFPQHRVQISWPFWIGKFVVTQEQWMALFPTNPSANKDKPKNPVENLDWNQASGFAKVLSEKLGRTFRLPSEAEWEYACRAGTATEFYFGNDAAKVSDFGWASGAGSTKPVGQKKPNAWGISDMAGNVWEWVEDWYGKYESGTQTDPKGAPAGGVRLLRGGSWYSPPWHLRSAYRCPHATGDRNSTFDFRVVFAPGPQEAPKVAAEDVKAGKWVSLFDGKTLDGWKVAEGGEFGGHGRVGVENGRICLETGNQPTGIVTTLTVPTVDYEISLDAMRVAGNDDLCIIVFPVGTTYCRLQVGGWGGRVVCLDEVDGRRGVDNLTARQMDFERRRWYRVRLQVTQASIEAWIDQEKVIDMKRAGHQFALRGAYAALTPLGIQSATTYAALRDLKLRRLGQGRQHAE